MMYTKMLETPSPGNKRTNGRRQEQPPGTGHPARTPDIQPLEIYMARTLQKKLQGPDIRRPARTSGPHQKSGLNPGHPALASREHRNLPRQSGHPAFAPDIRRLPKPRTSAPFERTSGIAHPVNRRVKSTGPDIRPLQPGHPAPRERPDIRPVARTSGALCLHAAPLGRDPCTPSPFDYIYSLIPYVLGLALV